MSEKERLLKLTLLSEEIREKHGVLIVIYMSACGYLYNLEMSDGGTHLGGCDYDGDCLESGAYTSYNNALQDAIGLVQSYPLKNFEIARRPKGEHWSTYCSVAVKFYPKEEGTIRKVDYSSIDNQIKFVGRHKSTAIVSVANNIK